MMNVTEIQPMSRILNKYVLWYRADVASILEPARELLENNSGIHPDQLIDHVTNMVCLNSSRVMNSLGNIDIPISQREKVWSVAPYTCIGSFIFLVLGFHTSPLYHSIICWTMMKD